MCVCVYVCVMREPDDDIKLETLHRCCFYSHTQTYPDKAVENGVAKQGTRPGPGQGGGKRTNKADKLDRQSRTTQTRSGQGGAAKQARQCLNNGNKPGPQLRSHGAATTIMASHAFLKN